jgi:HAE1 family hydrophobic/amphiphilic exporter-1
VLLSKEMLQISRSNLEQKQRHLDEARKKYDSGTATDYDVLAAEVDVQNARPVVIRSDNLIRTAQDRLRFLIGLDDQPVDAVGELSAPVGAYPTFDLTLEQAIKNRPDLWELEHQENVTKDLVKIYSAGNKPRLDFRSGVGYRHMSIGMGHEGGLAYLAGVYMTFPAWDAGRTKGKVMQAQSDLATLKIQRAQLADAIALQVRDAINAVKEAGEVVQALAGTVAQAEKLLSMAEKGYEFGVKTRLDIDDAQLNLLQAKTNLAKARRDYLAARISLEWVAGSIKL